MFYKVDLKKHFNHQLFYDEVISEFQNEIGLENSYILKENNTLLKKDNFAGIEFKLEFDGNDNVICNKQILDVNCKASKIHFLAISTWIDTIEYFKVIYEDESVENIQVPFLNWTEKTGSNCELYYYVEKDKIKTVSQTIATGAFSRLVYFHYSYALLNNNKIIKQIVLPDNLLIHIFAITLEKKEG